MAAHRRTTGIAATGVSLMLAAATLIATGSTVTGAAETPSAPDIAAMGPVTLTILSNGEDDYTKSVDEGFEAEYPNVDVVREIKPFADLQATAGLILSGSDVPDLINIAQGLPFMGVVVRAGLLRPLDEDAEIYGWSERFAPSLLSLNRMVPDGSRWGTGDLYGLSDGAEFLGVFYNKAKLRELGLEVPATWDEFVAILAAAKEAGEVPLMMGGLDKWMPPFVFEQIQSAYEDKAFTLDWAYGNTPESFDTPANAEAARIFQDWAMQGYFNEGFLGLPAEEAQRQFAAGTGLFFPQATGWTQLFQQQTEPDAIGWFVMPGQDGELVSHGNLAVAYSIPARAAHPEVAAAYLDYLTSEESQNRAAEHGLLPASNAPTSAATSALFEDISASWQAVQAADGFVPYLVNRTETMFTTMTERAQELLAGRLSPEEFVGAIDDDAQGQDG